MENSTVAALAAANFPDHEPALLISDSDTYVVLKAKDGVDTLQAWVFLAKETTETGPTLIVAADPLLLGIEIGNVWASGDSLDYIPQLQVADIVRNLALLSIIEEGAALFAAQQKL